MESKKKKYTIIGIVILLALAIGIITTIIINNSSSETPIKDTKTNKENITPLMYEVTKEGSNNKIYLFGSIHMADTDKFNFPDYLTNAYNKSQYLACEFDIVEYQKDQEKMLQGIQDLIYNDGTTIKDHLSKDTYNKLVTFLKEKEMYTEMYDIYKPIYFESLITSIMANEAKIKINDGIDTYFLDKAKTDNKTILEVESYDYQIKLLSTFSDQLYELLISDLLDKYDEEVQSLKDLYDAWKKGDIERIVKASNDELEIKSNYTKEEISIIKDYNKKLLDDRNINMTNKLIDYFNNNHDTFYMVGAAHLVGDKGIAKLLQEKGYNVKQMR